MDVYIGKRLSLRDQLCTLRYIGPVVDKPGEWWGVEWDDTQRGKHDGTHDGVQYFHCRSRSPTAASFLRPIQAWDQPRSLLDALREKYMPSRSTAGEQPVYISGKQAEEIGFAKFAQRQAHLQGIHAIVLDHMRIAYSSQDATYASLPETCANVTHLDLASNLYEDISEVLYVCRPLLKLRSLSLDGNRFSSSFDAQAVHPLETVQTLSISNTLLPSESLCWLVGRCFPNASSLVCANNELSSFSSGQMLRNVRHLDLSGNEFVDLMALLRDLKDLDLTTLKLSHNRISTLDVSAMRPRARLPSVHSLNLSHNSINDLSFFDRLAPSIPTLRHLQVAGNPTYTKLKSAEGKNLVPEDGYMLTMARIPQIETLNHSKVTEKERLNAEAYYLNQIAVELSEVSEDHQQEVLQRHLRWKALCEEYGEPVILRKSEKEELNPNSLAARLVTITFTAGEQIWTEEIPKSLSVYSLLGLVGKRLGMTPTKLRLVWETDERDPMRQNEGYGGPEWWDSSDDEMEPGASEGGGEWVTREVELVAGTRALGTYVEGRSAMLRVEVKDDHHKWGRDNQRSSKHSAARPS